MDNRVEPAAEHALRLIEVEQRLTAESQGTFELGPISLEARAGELVAVVGRSGSGKTTLLQLLGLLARPSSGEVIIGGASTHDLGDDDLASLRRRQLGFVFQAAHLLPQLTAVQNVALATGSLSASARGRAAEALSSLGLADRLAHHPSELSTGQQQRVAIARALVNEPTIVLADEPTGNLDRRTEDEVLDLLHAQTGHGRTVIVVTHSEAVASVAHRVVTLDEGRIVGTEALESAQ